MQSVHYDYEASISILWHSKFSCHSESMVSAWGALPRCGLGKTSAKNGGLLSCWVRKKYQIRYLSFSIQSVFAEELPSRIFNWRSSFRQPVFFRLVQVEALTTSFPVEIDSTRSKFHYFDCPWFQGWRTQWEDDQSRYTYFCRGGSLCEMHTVPRQPGILGRPRLVFTWLRSNHASCQCRGACASHGQHVPCS